MGTENLDGMQADIPRLALDVDWQRTGMLSVATEPHQVAWLQEAADDGEGRFLAQDEVRAEVASPTYLAGLFSPDSTAIVHPAKLAFELARACAEAGVHIFEHTNVTAMDGASRTDHVLGGRRRSHRRPGRAGHQRLPQPGRAQPAADHSGL